MKQTVLIIIGLLVAMLPACAQGDRQLVSQGNQLYRQDNYPQAELCYRKAIAAQPANGTAHYNLGCALQKQKKDQQALVQYKQAAKTISGPKRQSQAYYNMGTVLQGQKEYDKAMEAYKNALRMNPQNERARYNYVQCKRLLKQQQQQQKNQKQNKNQKDKNKNKNKKKDQNKQQNQKQKDQQKQKQQDQNQMSRQNAEQLLNAAMLKEQETQQRLKQAMRQPNKRKLDKNW